MSNDDEKINKNESLRQIPEEFYSATNANETRVLSLKVSAQMKGLLDLVVRNEKERDRQRTLLTLTNEALTQYVLQKLQEFGYDTSSIKLQKK